MYAQRFLTAFVPALLFALALPGVVPTAALADPASPEVLAQGKLVSQIGGCNDCHTQGYAEAAGNIPQEKWLMGSPIGHNGPWGTTYASNLRLIAARMSEDEWVSYLAALKTRPPMPWFNVRFLPESDMRALHAFICSLGAPGEKMPEALPPGVLPTTAYIVDAPPIMP